MNQLPPLRGNDNSKPQDYYGNRDGRLPTYNEEYQANVEKEDLIICKGDAKPEAHFIGRIVGGADFNTSEGLFCEMLVQVGENWELLSQNVLYQTQTCYADVDEIFVWSHPFDLHFSSGDLGGWPKAIFIVWRLDSSNKMDTFAYGVLNLPRTKGFHKIECDTWTPLSSRFANNMSFFMGTYPRLKEREVISNGIEKRHYLKTSSSGKVIIEIEVLLKNFKLLGVSE